MLQFVGFPCLGDGGFPLASSTLISVFIVEVELAEASRIKGLRR
jgi:hypothetical protein